MTWGAALVASLFATLGRPRWWVLALAGFLVRGGLLVVLVPLVELPSAAGLANLLGPVVIGFAFGNTPPAIVLLVGWAAAAAIAWLLASTILGAWFELALAREAAEDDELERALPSPLGEAHRGGGGGSAAGPWLVGRAVVARLLAHVPTAVVLAVGALRIGEATYAELIGPGDGTLPVALRVILRVPETVLLLVAVWLAGEAVGGYAVRRVAVGEPVGSALRSAFRGVLGRGSGLATLVATAVPAVAAGAIVVVALGQVWEQLRATILDDSSPLAVLGTIWVLAGVWFAGLWLLSLATAWRSAAWSFEAFRRDP